MRDVRRVRPFRTLAVVLLPDHIHCLWALPAGDADFSDRWRRIKSQFTERWLDAGRPESLVGRSRLRSGERGVWQRRFWERTVRDEAELNGICDYIHHNPVKHGYVASPGDWPWSSFHRFARAGHYPAGWGRSGSVGQAGHVGE